MAEICGLPQWQAAEAHNFGNDRPPDQLLRPISVHGGKPMRGTLLLYRPFGREPEITEFAAEPEFSELQVLVGGPLEVVPGFFSIEHDGAVRRCVAFCDANGKRKGLPLNMMATILWDSALRREMGIGLLRRDGKRADHLVGVVPILFGHT